MCTIWSLLMEHMWWEGKSRTAAFVSAFPKVATPSSVSTAWVTSPFWHPGSQIASSLLPSQWVNILVVNHYSWWELIQACHESDDSFSLNFTVQFSSVQFSRSVVSDSLRPHESQHARLPCPSPTPGVHSNSHPSSWWCHPAISSSVVPFSSWPQSLPASESFPMSQLFAWGGQSTGISASASFLPTNTQDWSPSEWTGWISLQSKGLSRVFSNTTVQKHQFFGAQLSSPSNSHIHTWPLEKP